MSIPDRLISQYFRCFADVHVRELEELDTFIAESPLEAKKQLATFVIALETKSIEDGRRERESFERKFSQKEIRDEDCTELVEDAKTTLFDALMKSGQFKSRGELRRLFDQQAVRDLGSEGKETTSLESLVGQLQGVVRVGKRRFFRFVMA